MLIICSHDTIPQYIRKIYLLQTIQIRMAWYMGKHIFNERFMRRCHFIKLWSNGCFLMLDWNQCTWLHLGHLRRRIHDFGKGPWSNGSLVTCGHVGEPCGEKLQLVKNTGPHGKEDSIEIGSHHVHLFSGSVVIFWGARYIIQFSKSIYFGQNVGLFLVIFIRLSSHLFGCLNVCPSTTLTATIWLLKPFVILKCGGGGLHLMAGLSCDIQTTANLISAGRVDSDIFCHGVGWDNANMNAAWSQMQKTSFTHFLCLKLNICIISIVKTHLNLSDIVTIPGV